MTVTGLQFASVSEDSVLNVWSMPELSQSTGGGGGGRGKVVLDMTARLTDLTLTGVQFVSPAGSRSAVPHIAVASYDVHQLRVFLGM
jgi:hypothetical protein